MSLKKYGGVSCLSAVEEERLFHAGRAEAGLCLALYNSHLSRLVKTVWMWTLLDGQKETMWAVCPSVRASTMRTCVCFTYPLSSSHESDLTFSSTKRNVEGEVPWFIDVATQMPSPRMFCDTRSSELKILQGLGRVPMMDPTQNPSAELLQLRYIRLNFQKALGGMIACEWCQGGRPQVMSPTSLPATGKDRTYLPTPKASSLGVSCAGEGVPGVSVEQWWFDTQTSVMPRWQSTSASPQPSARQVLWDQTATEGVILGSQLHLNVPVRQLIDMTTFLCKWKSLLCLDGLSFLVNFLFHLK